MPAGGLGTAAAVGLIGSVAAPAIGGLMGNLFGSGDRDKAAQAQLAALQQFQGIKVPTVEEQQIALQKLQSVGDYDPAMEAALQQGPSQMAGIQVDPRLKEAQMGALAKLQQLGQTGLSSEDRASLGDIQRSSAGQANAANQAAIQNMQARGMGGAGQELAMRLAANQAAANQGNQQGMQVAAQAQNKALQAISQAGMLGGQMGQQQFGQQADIARAQDMINSFNVNNRQNVANTNVQAGNQAQQYNLQNKQNISNQNVGLTNQQEMYNKALAQTNFNNQMSKAMGAAGQSGHVADMYTNNANATQGAFSGVGNAVGGAAGTAAGYSMLANKQKKPDAGSTAPMTGEQLADLYTS